MKNLLKYSWTLYFALIFVLSFAVLYPFFLVLLSKKKWYIRSTKAKTNLGQGCLMFYIQVLRPEVTYEELARQKQ